MNNGISSLRSSTDDCVGPDLLKEALNSSSSQVSNGSFNQRQTAVEEEEHVSPSPSSNLVASPEELALIAARRWYLHRQQARMNSFIAQNENLSSSDSTRRNVPSRFDCNRNTNEKQDDHAEIDPLYSSFSSDEGHPSTGSSSIPVNISHLARQDQSTQNYEEEETGSALSDGEISVHPNQIQDQLFGVPPDTLAGLQAMDPLRTSSFDSTLSIDVKEVNASKAQLLKGSLLNGLVHLGFKESLTRTALEAGAQEIIHFDAECELSFVDIFMSLVRMVADAHIDYLSMNHHQNKNGIRDTTSGAADALFGVATATAQCSSSFSSREFIWPVFDMAQFEFGNARPGTCFENVCVLTNVPKVSIERSHELIDLMSSFLFTMVGDPIQVILPSSSSTGRTKGTAFLEFDDHLLAKVCATAVEGLQWGSGPSAFIRARLFRDYQVFSDSTNSVSASQMSFQALYQAAAAASSTLQQQQQNQSYNDYHADASDTKPAWQSGSEEDDSEWDENDEEDEDEEDKETVEFLNNRWRNPSPPRLRRHLTQKLERLSLSSDDEEEEEEEEEKDLNARHDGSTMRGTTVKNDGSSISDSRIPVRRIKRRTGRDVSDFLEENVPVVSSGAIPTDITTTTTTTTDSQIQQDSHVQSDQQVEMDLSDVNRPWKEYCQDVLGRNRELNDELTLSRRKMAQLAHHSQKLQLLLDRVERDRDGLLFENELLQTQLIGYQEHEQQHEQLVNDVLHLRYRLKKKDRKCLQITKQLELLQDKTSKAKELDLVCKLEDLIHDGQGLSDCNLEALKAVEQKIEKWLTQVRQKKEEKALDEKLLQTRQLEAQQKELKLCVICLCNEKRILCLPCRHLCLCGECSSRQELTKCPICRVEIDEMLVVYA